MSDYTRETVPTQGGCSSDRRSRIAPAI